MNYYYEAAKIHLQGKGFLGYLKSRISDVTASIESENVVTNGFNTTYFYPNEQLELSKRLSTNDTIQKSKSTFTHILLNAITKRIFIYPQVTVQTNKLTGHKITTTTSSYDNYGNPGSVVKTYLNGPTETTTTIFESIVSTSQWLIGRPTSTTLQYTGGGSTITRSGSRVFSSTSNNLNSETWHSGTNWQIVKGFKYNTNGTLKRDSATANGVYRPNIYTYETDNIRVKTTKDPLLHTTTNTYDSYGRLYTQADYLGNTLTYT
jgi:YD repeat-containing protein